MSGINVVTYLLDAATQQFVVKELKIKVDRE